MASVHLYDRLISPPDNEERRRLDFGKCIAGQIRAPTPRDDGTGDRRTRRRPDQRRRGTCARTEITDRQLPQIGSTLCPVRGEHYTAPEQVDVETVLAREHVNRLFLSSEQIEQERPESVGLQELSDRAIPATESAAAAAMREDDEACRALRHAQIGADVASFDGDYNRFACSYTAHLSSSSGVPGS
jgi:hypothetical protein